MSTQPFAKGWVDRFYQLCYYTSHSEQNINNSKEVKLSENIDEKASDQKEDNFPEGSTSQALAERAKATTQTLRWLEQILPAEALP